MMVLLLWMSHPVWASEVKQIKISGNGKKDLFGQTVSVSGNYAIAGSPKDDEYGKDSGLARIFRYTGKVWKPTAVLRSPEDLSFGHFGYSVAVYDDPSSDSGDYAIAGACSSDGASLNSGAAYIFRRSSSDASAWICHNTLKANDGKRNDDFGFSVSISGDTAIVGAYRNDGAGTDAGAAYIFKNSRGTWSQQAKLQADDAGDRDYFGRSVSISGDYAVVGAHGRDDKGAEAGAAYVFYNSGNQWIQKGKLLAADGAAGDFFGFSVSISGSSVIVGAYADDDRGESSGAAYIFSRNSAGNWLQTAKLTAGDGGLRSFFGRSVSLSGNCAAVGADGTENKSGAVYIFRKNGSSWNQTEKLTADDSQAGDRLGASVSLTVSPLSPDSFRSIAGAGTGTEADGTSEAVYFFGNDPASSPSIFVSPTSLSLNNCYKVGRAAEEQTDLSLSIESDDLSAFGMGLLIPDEVKKYWETYIPPPQNPGIDPYTLPDLVDWSADDSPVKYQGGCGACSVFAAVALVENLANRENRENKTNFPIRPDLSEQALLACTDGITCSGGWYWNILSYINQYGAVPDNCYTYVGKKGNCDDACEFPDYRVKIGSSTPMSGLWGEDHSADDLRLALQNGPLVVSMRVPPNHTFTGSGYRGGIYDYDDNEGEISWSSNGHAVLLVGYNHNEKYFKAKNSWGPAWGENGYFRIAYNDVTGHVKFGSYACSASGAYLSEKATVLSISNRGTADLIISSITASQPWLSISPNAAGMTILPNAEETFIVSVLNWEVISIAGTPAQISIASNDPLNSSVTVNVTASRPPCSNGQEIIGNINCSSGVDLQDAVLALQVLAGINADGICPDYPASGTDANDDGRIGMEEVVYILRELSK